MGGGTFEQMKPVDQVAEIAKYGFVNKDGPNGANGSHYDPTEVDPTTKKTGVFTDVDGKKWQSSAQDALSARKLDADPLFSEAEITAATAKTAEVSSAVEKKETGQTGVQVETATAIAKAHTAIDLEALKAQIGLEGMGKLVEDVNISNEKLPTSNFLLTKNFDLKSLKDGLKAQFVDKFKTKNFANLTALLNKSFPEAALKDDTVADFMAEIYANSAVSKLIETKKFADFQAKMTNEDSYQLAYDVTVNDTTGLTVGLVANDKFDSAYQAFEKNNPDKSAEKPEKASDVKTEQLLDRAHKLRVSPSGKFLSMLGVITIEGVPEGGDADDAAKAARETRNDKAYAAALNGDNFIAQWVIWLFGGAAMLEDGGSAIAETVKGLDPKYGVLVTKLHNGMSKGPLSLKKIADTLAVQVEVEKFAKMDKAKFGKFLEGKEKMPETGLKLTEDFMVPADSKLSVALKDGGEMVVPTKQFVRLSDKTTIQAGEKDPERVKDKNLAIIEKIPSGTVFSGKAVLELSKLEV